MKECEECLKKCGITHQGSSRYVCSNCKVEQHWLDGRPPKMCLDCATKLSKCQRCENVIK